ncbi:MAG: hypothetical protein NWE94_05455, partial [Candidatus Bathyarchaeota archaeon]|nr:hypothetical protein [Candidatus Bathyarchaeota archaeon]
MKKKRGKSIKKAAFQIKRAKLKASVKPNSHTSTLNQAGRFPEFSQSKPQLLSDYEWKPQLIKKPPQLSYRSGQLRLREPDFCFRFDSDRIPAEKKDNNDDLIAFFHEMRGCADFRVIDDPLAYYIQYSDLNIGSQQGDKYWGIYFKVEEMDSCYRGFLGFFRASVNLDVKALWNLFVEFVFWHELAHHVLQDLRTLKGEDQAAAWIQYIFDKSEEEGFCEFFAFKTAEEGS